ncbi:MAG TPA: CRTAC1 family protein [Vicinamibacteria bacterium]|nr:CRTAC1 family protein [Vicinamibacteria bacterium]
MLLFVGLLTLFPHFVDRAQEAGLHVIAYCGGPTKDHILESTGNGVLVLDYDQDGFADLYFVNAHRDDVPHTSVLYRNRGDGTFEDVTARAGVETSCFGQGGAVGDVDADGLPDLYVTAFGPNVLFRNNGDGTFSDWTAHAGVEAPSWSIGAVFFDPDRDGDEDLFVSSYIEASWEDVARGRRTRLWRGKVLVLDGPKGLRGASNVFYRNEGDGRFTEATEEAGFGVGSDYYSMAAATVDFDGDGDLDLYVANDSTPNCLYRNKGHGKFEEVGVEMGVAYSADGNSQGSMGIATGDVDGDGFVELVVTNFAHDYYTLFRNLGGALFFDDSFTWGIAVPTFAPLGWGALLFDVDHDRDLDLFFANGHIYPQVDEDSSLGESYRQTNQLFENDGTRFVEVTEKAGPGFGVRESSRGAASADFDDDGDLDIVVSNEDASPTFLVNETATSHWVSLDVRGPSGVRVECLVGGRRQVRWASSDGSYASASDRRIHFGLGDADTIESLEISWPDGSRDEHRALEGDRRYILKKGQPPIAVP